MTDPTSTPPTQAQAPAQAPAEPPVQLWLLGTPTARALAADAGVFEDLQSVLLCCDLLLGGLAGAREEPGGEAVVESVWATAVVCYARCFTSADQAPGLTEADLLAAMPEHEQALDWHRALVSLGSNQGPEQRPTPPSYAVGAVRAADGTAAGLGLTSEARLLPDEVTVRSAGSIAFALRAAVETRIGERQQALFTEVSALSSADLDRLPRSEARTGG